MSDQNPPTIDDLVDLLTVAGEDARKAGDSRKARALGWAMDVLVEYELERLQTARRTLVTGGMSTVPTRRGDASHDSSALIEGWMAGNAVSLAKQLEGAA